MRHRRDLPGHHRRGLLDRRQVVAIAFGNYLRHVGHQIDDIAGDFVVNKLLLVDIQLFKSVSRERSAVLHDAVSDRVKLDPLVGVDVIQLGIIAIGRLSSGLVDVPH
jgi:hypothetical protein